MDGGGVGGCDDDDDDDDAKAAKAKQRREQHKQLKASRKNNKKQRQKQKNNSPQRKSPRFSSICQGGGLLDQSDTLATKMGSAQLNTLIVLCFVKHFVVSTRLKPRQNPPLLVGYVQNLTRLKRTKGVRGIPKMCQGNLCIKLVSFQVEINIIHLGKTTTLVNSWNIIEKPSPS